MSAIRDNIITNYLQTYSPSITRYDSHKKSELRNTYNSIVKLNKETPWYLPVTNTGSQVFAVSLKENARELHNEIAEIGGLEEDGLLKGKSAYSTNPESVEVSFIGEDIDPEEVPSFEIEVKSLATPQENSGKFLNANSPTGLSESNYSFDIGINGMNYEFQFAIGENETNLEVQERLARLINNSGIGISAEIEEDEGRTSLKIISDATGTAPGRDHIFAVSDENTSKTKGAVSYFGLDNVVTQPSNASFLLNGDEHEAYSNNFTVGKMYELTLTGVTPEGETVGIGLKTDSEAITDNVTKLIGSYNNFLKAASLYTENQARGKILSEEFSRIGKYYSEQLRDVGVNVTEDGTLSIDDEKLHEAAENSPDLKSTFAPIKDFSNSLLRKSDQIALNPMEYVQRTVVAYKNPGHNFASPYNTSSYSGMMYNYFC